MWNTGLFEYFITYRSSRLHMFFKIGVRKNFANFTRKHLFWSLSLKEKKKTPTQVFPCEISNIFKNTFF